MQKRQKSPSPSRSEKRQAPSKSPSQPLPENIYETQRDTVETPKATGDTLVEEKEEVAEEPVEVLEVSASERKPPAADPSFTSVFDIEPPFKESDSSFLNSN